MPLPECVNDFLADAREWCRGRFWPGRLLLWLWFAWLAVHYTRDANFGSFLDGLNLGIHEFGFQIFERLIIKVELAFQRPVRDAALTLEQLSHLR